jgi:Nucleotidyl transferase AbiEii toxin, Type IV TA system
MAKEIRNIGASVGVRLLQLSKANRQSFELVLTRFALERLLYRIGRSQHSNRFVLKGAMLMMSWFDDPHRGTRDIDLLGFGDPIPDAMVEVFRNILAQQVVDSVEFDPAACASTASANNLIMAACGCEQVRPSAVLIWV